MTAHTVALELAQQDAITAVTAALAAPRRPPRISPSGLGACNPALAHQAPSSDPEIGLLPPCNVTVRQAGGHTLVQAVDPAELLAMAGTGDRQPTALTEVARDAAARLRAALDSLTAAV